MTAETAMTAQYESSLLKRAGISLFCENLYTIASYIAKSTTKRWEKTLPPLAGEGEYIKSIIVIARAFNSEF